MNAAGRHGGVARVNADRILTLAMPPGASFLSPRLFASAFQFLTDNAGQRERPTCLSEIQPSRFCCLHFHQ